MIVWGRCPRRIDDEVEPNKVLGVTHTRRRRRESDRCMRAISGAVDDDDLVRAVCIERPDDRAGGRPGTDHPAISVPRVKAVRLPQVVEQSFTVGVVRQHTGPAEDHRVRRADRVDVCDLGHACAASTFSGVVTDRPT